MATTTAILSDTLANVQGKLDEARQALDALSQERADHGVFESKFPYAHGPMSTGRVMRLVLIHHSGLGGTHLVLFGLIMCCGPA